MAFILTRINVGDYERWKPMFDADTPGTRKDAKSHRVFRSQDNPGEVLILIEYASAEDARAARERLIGSGVLDRFADKTLPNLLEEAEAKTY